MAFILLFLAAVLFAATLVLLWRSGAGDAAPVRRPGGRVNRPVRTVARGKDKPAPDGKEPPRPSMITIALVFPAADPAEPLYTPDGRLKNRFHPRF
ncbi:hypothetical protein [Desulfotomaculum copahuensis]|uniref:Uncharacterized protein n=1 Tax=Desulfotomaculum copahuensis TaxID=1838280 RepID=A0A1B7LIJ7_9FIRM|nr:hypothetical protein [Desulfotomaculum copahuensis]OAT86399.1 hypothetical protein A6M21_02935 [Desulfotomaculum copahuensis]